MQELKLYLLKLKHFWQRSLVSKITILLAVFFVSSLVGGYTGNWYFSWVGVSDYVTSQNVERGKTLWDWLDLLIVPLALAFGVFLLNRTEGRATQQVEENRVREENLQNYIDRMEQFILREELVLDTKAIEIARARTLTVLESLDGKRKGAILRFLYGAGLILSERPAISLGKANFNDIFLDDEANLSGINLKDANLAKANLYRVNFGKAILDTVNFRHAQLQRAYFEVANLFGSNFSNADLSRAIFIKAELSNSNFTETILTDADLSYASARVTNLSSSNLENANLYGANFGGADLHSAILNKADLRETNFDGANLEKASFADAKFGFGTSCERAKLKSVSLQGLDLQGINFNFADLTKVNLKHANLTGASFIGADLSNANLRDVNLKSANLLGAKLNNANLRGANLTETNLERVGYNFSTVWPSNFVLPKEVD
jgi:uncharacterized protein YjbI with pentapeptide repeats